MFVRASTVILAIAAGLLAVPGAAADMPASQCDASNLKCCDSTLSGASAASLASLLGLVFDPTALLGINCDPIIPVIGTGTGADCTQQPVCCTDVQQNGLINAGCTPVNINL